SKNQVFLKIAN
nr:immunoglobulin heavy chain junction region [Mus musculus]